MAILISDVNLKKDFIELKNTLSTARNISGWTIIDTTKTNQRLHKFVFPDGTKIYGKATLRLWSRDGADDPQNVYWNRGQNVWNNPGDRATVYTNDGKFVDEQTFGYGIVEGIVRRAQPSKPIKDAEITVDTGEIAFTESDGFFSLRLQGMSPRGVNRKITVKAKGYATKEIVAGVWVGQTTKVQIALEDEEKAKDEEIDLSVESVDKPEPAYIKEPHDITITFKNNKSAIDYFESHLFENEKEVDDYSTSAKINSKDVVVATYQISAKDWNWYDFDNLGYVQINNRKKKYNYEISYSGKLGKVQGKTKREDLGAVEVTVLKEKINAVGDYNDAWDLILSMAAAGTISAFAAPEALPFEALIAVFANARKEDAKDRMDDPITYDRNFKKVYDVQLPIRTKSRHNNFIIEATDMVRSLKACRVTQNRLYSSQLKRQKKYVTMHKSNLNKIKLRLVKFMKNTKYIKLPLPMLSLTEFKLAQQLVRKYGLPKTLINYFARGKIPDKTLQCVEKLLPKLRNHKYRNANNIFWNSVKKLKCAVHAQIQTPLPK